MSERTLNQWLTWSPSDGAALLELAEELLPSENHLKEIMGWLEEIEVRDGLSPAAVLAEQPLRASLLDRKVGRSDRLKRVKACIWKRRFPRLAKLQGELHELAVENGLAGGRLSIAFPPGLEGEEITISLRPGSEAELKGFIEHIERCLQRGVFTRLFSLLHHCGPEGGVR